VTHIDDQATYQQVMCDFILIGRRLNFMPCHIKFTKYLDNRFYMGWVNVGSKEQRFKTQIKEILEERKPEERLYVFSNTLRIRLDNGKDVRVYRKNRSFFDPVHCFWEFEVYFRNFGIRKPIEINS